MASLPLASSTSPDTIEQLLRAYARTDAARFTVFFRRMRISDPEDCALGCLQHLSESGDPQISRQMTLWLCSGVEYIGRVFDPQIAPLDGTKRLAITLRDADPQFFTKLSRFLQDPRTPKPNPLIVRLLSVVPALGECGMLLPWLRTLDDHPDDSIRLQAAKTQCQIRPTWAMVDRLLQSPEPQTRADALEALWREPNSESRTVFHYASTDSDHRVVSNALVGLYLAGEENLSIEKMGQLAEHKSAMFRLAAVAAMTKIRDERCVPTLKRLALDQTPIVRNAAKTALQEGPTKK
jgi:hypothetical protein